MEDKFIYKIKNQLLWFKELLRLNWAGMLEYRTSFFIQMVGMAINNVAFLIVWYFFFQVFEDVNGWEYKEMIGLLGIISIPYGIIFSFGFGMKKISNAVMYGQLDKFLIQPKSVLLNIILSEVNVSAVGDLVFGIMTLFAYIIIADISFSQLLLLPIILLAATFITIGFLITVQSIIFWIPNSEELSNSLFEFLLGPSMYPVSTYVGFVKIFFIFFVPAMLIGGVPLNVMIEQNYIHLLYLLGFAVMWIMLGIFVFYRGLKRYESGNLVGTR